MQNSGDGHFRLIYHERVLTNDFPAIAATWRRKIKQAISQKLFIAPQLYGKPLRYPLNSLHKLRVGDYRIIFSLEGKIVRVLIAGHRSVVYKLIGKRI